MSFVGNFLAAGDFFGEFEEGFCKIYNSRICAPGYGATPQAATGLSEAREAAEAIAEWRNTPLYDKLAPKILFKQSFPRADK